MIKAIIHDWDDTITNAFETYTEFYFDLGKHFNLEGAHLEKIRKHWGNPIAKIVNGIWPHFSPEEAENKTIEFQKVLAEWRKSYEAKVFDGMGESIKTLHEAGIKLGVLSSGHRPTIEKIYREQIDPNLTYHEFIFDSHDLTAAKPDPKVFDRPFELLSKMGILEEETIYVGDHINDLMAAQNRSLTFFAVTTGITTKEDFIQAGLEEKFVLESFNDLLKHVL